MFRIPFFSKLHREAGYRLSLFFTAPAPGAGAPRRRVKNKNATQGFPYTA